jgi:hypothetical protein
VAQLRISPLVESGFDNNILKVIINYEFNAISFVRRKTNIPIPQIYVFEVKNGCSIKILFILIDCLEDNIEIDLGIKIPPKYK